MDLPGPDLLGNDMKRGPLCVQLRLKVVKAKRAIQQTPPSSHCRAAHSSLNGASRSPVSPSLLAALLPPSAALASLSQLEACLHGVQPSTEVVPGQHHADDDGMCIICMEEMPDVVFQACGHAVACASCAARVAAKINACPMCRMRLDNHQPFKVSE